MSKAKTDKKPPPQEKPLRKLVLIDDEAERWAGPLDQGLRPLGFDLSIETRAERALTVIRSRRPAVVLLDLHFPNDDRRKDDRTTGGELLSKIRKEFERLPVVIFTTRLADGDIALEAFGEQPHGLFDKSQISASQRKGEPWPSKLAWSLNNAIEIAEAEHKDDDADMGFVVGKTDAMRRVSAQVRNAARHTLPVLIYGEIGTEKYDVAAAIHKLSARSGRFEQVNCSGAHGDALPAQLFGLARSAPPTAAGESPGLLELADGGTLFVDQIQAMPMALQHQVMTAVENKVVRRMGGDKDIPVNVRLVAATNQPLSELVADELLHEDLAQRLTPFKIEVPPLRARMQDLEAVCERVIEKGNQSLHRHVMPTLRPEVREKLRAHTWPGNIRELFSTLERAIATTRSNVLSVDDIEISPLPFRKNNAPASPGSSNPNSPTEGGTSGLVDMASNHATKIESMPIGDRYAFLKNHLGDESRRLVLIEIVRRLRRQQAKKVQHKHLANFLDPIKDPEKDFERIRQMVCEAEVKLTELDFNQ